MKSTAHVITDRPERYGKQLASHFTKKCETEWDGQRGWVAFPAMDRNNFTPGRVELIAGEDLTMEIDTAGEVVETYERIVARHLVMFGRKDDLRVEWIREDGTPGLVFSVADLPADRAGRPS